MRRREFVQVTGMATAGLLIGGRGRAYAFNQSPRIPLFGTPLRGVGPGGNIPVALPAPGAKAPITGVTRYNLKIMQYQDQIVPASSGLGPTTLWGYVPTNGLGDLKLDGSMVPRHLGGVIIGQKGVPIQINFKNQLSGAAQSQHIIPVDTTIPGANQAPNRTAVHLHGGLVPWISDGGPFDWFNFGGLHGSSFLNNQVLNPKAPANSAEYYYGMDQSARFLWYHDHAVGITRLNAYAGIASGLLLRDSFEGNLRNQGLPNFIEAGGNELPLIIQEKVFVGPDIATQDPTWLSINLQKVTRNPGSLWYAHVYDPERWDVGEGGLALPNPSAIPEFFGDTMLVNGTAYPQVTVQARRYRLRLLNATNARFLNLQLYVANNSPNGITLDADGFPTNTAFNNHAAGDEPYWLQIGTEGGFLAKPALVPSNVPLTFQVPPGPDPDTGQIDPSTINKSLVVAPAERPDVIVDFAGYAGQSIVLYADAPAPFPGGGPETDFFPGLDNGNPVNADTPNGFGPNSRVLMRFNVVPATGAADPPLNINTGTDMKPGLDPFIIDPAILKTGVPVPPGYNTRTLSLNEYFDEYGRLIQILGNQAAPYGSPYFGTASYLDDPPGNQGATEENVNAGDTEVWEIFNMTGDVHPMHFHLVNVQVINRQLFDMGAFPESKDFTGPEIPPDDNELGWKETVPMYPGTVTRVIMKFDVPKILTATGQVIPTPVSPRTGGNEYVWHCHILEHEEHDMMHACVVT
jgi:FtsP/CotA-like multicopper oxidase with cupredoxin domain